MTVVDAGLLLLLVLFALRGFWRGFLRETLGIAGLVLAAMLVVRWSEPLAGMLAARAAMSPLMARVLSAVGIALAVFLAVRILGALVVRLTSLIFLRPIDRVAGVGLGLAEGVALLGLGLAAVLRLAPTSDVSHWIAASRLAPPLLHVADRIVEVARPIADATRNTI
jgi:membrane protein required for colicin V production